MPSPPRSRSRFRSATSGLAALLVGAAALAAAGCGDDDACGPGDEDAPGLRVEDIVFGEMTASPNNDCPPSAGEHPTAITIQGSQVEPAAPGQFLVLCLPRPDLIDDEPVSFTDTERIELVNLSAATARAAISASTARPSRAAARSPSPASATTAPPVPASPSR